MLGILCVGAPWRRGGHGRAAGEQLCSGYDIYTKQTELVKVSWSGYDCAVRRGLGLFASGLAQGRGCAGVSDVTLETIASPGSACPALPTR
jgi:hypothetical protein